MVDYEKVRCPGCGCVPKRWATRKAGPNLGRFFIKCAKLVNEQCVGFFEWEDTLHIKRPELIAKVRQGYDPRHADGDEMSYPRADETSCTTSSASAARTAFEAMRGNWDWDDADYDEHYAR